MAIRAHHTGGGASAVKWPTSISGAPAAAIERNEGPSMAQQEASARWSAAGMAARASYLNAMTAQVEQAYAEEQRALGVLQAFGGLMRPGGSPPRMDEKRVASPVAPPSQPPSPPPQPPQPPPPPPQPAAAPAPPIAPPAAPVRPPQTPAAAQRLAARQQQTSAARPPASPPSPPKPAAPPKGRPRLAPTSVKGGWAVDADLGNKLQRGANFKGAASGTASIGPPVKAKNNWRSRDPLRASA